MNRADVVLGSCQLVWPQREYAHSILLAHDSKRRSPGVVAVRRFSKLRLPGSFGELQHLPRGGAPVEAVGAQPQRSSAEHADVRSRARRARSLQLPPAEGPGSDCRDRDDRNDGECDTKDRAHQASRQSVALDRRDSEGIADCQASASCPRGRSVIGSAWATRIRCTGRARICAMDSASAALARVFMRTSGGVLAFS